MAKRGEGSRLDGDGDDDAPTRPGPGVGHGPTAPLSPVEDAPSDGPVLGIGDMVAGRYRIVRFIAQGGMGEVYQAHDQELGEQVALKTIRLPASGLDGASQRAVERLRREIQLARRVTHPNVCRTFDVGRHRLAAGAEILFLTMELLSGETLLARIRASGRLSVEEALPIAEQIAAGLRAAHQAGVVHRDLSSANVVLTPKRVVVTDFGLALEHGGPEPDGARRPSNAEAVIVGSPAYMAPEQVTGEPVSPRADIYALGVVLYEMVTGVLPFPGETPLAIAMRRLEQPPAPPETLVPSLPPRWCRAIGRCLARDPADRFADVDELLAALREPAPRRTGRLIAAGLLVAVAAAAGTMAWRWSTGRPTSVASATRRSIAVIGFRDLGGAKDSGWLSTALAEQLGTELGAGGRLRLIPGESIARVKRDLALADADSYSPATLARLRLNLDADYVLVGSYLALPGGRLRIDLRLQDTVSGETAAAVAEEGTAGDLPPLVARAGARIRGALALPAPGAESRVPAPRTPSTARLYAEGLAALRGLDHPVARDKLRLAVAEDPELAPAWAALGEAWAGLGYVEEARRSLERAFELAAKLPREQRLVIEGQHRMMSGDFPRAVAIYRMLADLYPDDLDNGLRLAHALAVSGDRRGALDVLVALRRLPAPAAEDPRIELEEAYVRQLLWDFQGVARACERAAELARARGARLSLAAALAAEGRARYNLAQYDRAVALSAEAEKIFASAGDHASVASTLSMRAAAMHQLGDRKAAYRLTEEKLQIYRAMGHDGGVAATLAETAAEPEARGDFAEAARRLRDALPLFEKIGDLRGVHVTRIALANAELEQGRLDDSAFVAAAGHFASVQNKRMHAYALANHANLVAARGDEPGARRLYEEALATQEILDLPAAVASTRTGLAELAILRGAHDEARALAEQALATYAKAQHLDGEAAARALIAYSRARSGAPEEALAEATRAEALVTRSDRIAQRLAVSLWIARARGAAGDRARALAELERISTEAGQHGMVFTQLRARLAHATLAGDRPARSAALREARVHGLLGLVQEFP